ncbi:unnamed protein product [Allacma fusca]|uniref:Cilia- and flagella-associated protein 126 n=1 Tax=Allacma fusca TaxID=39272 RepID=A0A8J2P183_9HEXA|nr:unnamed protein product [Allacma fusca]
MSGQYSANQFNDAFSAKRLGNWETTVRHPGKFGSKRQGPTEVIADDRGHLLPHISRAGFSSPWGDHKAYVWETVGYGIPPKTDSNPPKARPKIAPKLPKFFKKPTKLPKLPAKRPQGVKPAVDPILNQLRERRLPIIWMVGLPTERIQKLREKFCEELSRALDYAYININDSIERWKLRQGVRFAEPVPCTGNLKENIPPSSSLPTRHKLQSAFQPASICIPAQISPSLLNQVIAYDKTPDRAALAYAYHVNIHRQSRQRQATAVSQVAQQFDPITGEEIQMNSPGNMIQFDLGQPFTRDKLMDLLKFAMVESNPTKGYIIDGVFLEEGDGSTSCSGSMYKHIKNYPNLTDEPKVNFFDPCYSEPEGDVSDAFLSPVNSAITTSRSVVEKVKDPIQEDIQEMINAHLPVIWVLGFRQADDEIRKWYDYDDINQSDIRSKVMSRIHCMSKVIMDKKESLTSEKTVELIKYAMLLSSESTNGYILDEFPISMAEGSLFEQQLYPCTSLVYFLNFTWTTNKSVEPDVQSPINLHREELYSEEMVEKVCNHHGYKAIKVWNAEDLDEHGMTAISNIIAECISASRNGQVPTTHSQLRSPCFRNLIMPEDEHINNDLLYDNYFPENTTRKPTVQRAQKVSALGSNRLVDLSDIESSQQSNDEDEANSEDNSLENTAHRECSQSDVEEATELIDLDNEEEQALLTEVVDLTENDDDVKNIWSGNEGDGTCLDVPNQQEMQPISTDDTNKKLEPFELDEGGGGDW